MTRYGCLLLGLFLMWAVSTLGQEEALTNPKFDVALGSSFMHFGTASSVNLMGVAISGQCRISNRLGFVGEFDTSYGSGTSARTLLFGPEISLRRRFSPFGHILIGGAHLSHGPRVARRSQRRSAAALISASRAKSRGGWVSSIIFLRISTRVGKVIFA